MSMDEILTFNEQGWKYSNRIPFSNPKDYFGMDVMQHEESEEEQRYKTQSYVAKLCCKAS